MPLFFGSYIHDGTEIRITARGTAPCGRFCLARILYIMGVENKHL